MIAGDQNAMLFITDEESYKYLSDLSDGEGLFEDEPLMFDDGFYKATETEAYESCPTGCVFPAAGYPIRCLKAKKAPPMRIRRLKKPFTA